MTSDPVFHAPFVAALADEEFTRRLDERELSLHFVPTDRPHHYFVCAAGVFVDEAPFKPTLRLELDSETAARIWRRELTVSKAAVTRRLVVKGPVARIGQFVELIPAIGAAFADAARTANIS